MKDTRCAPKRISKQKRIQRAQTVESLLDVYIPDPQVPLAHKDPYTLLIAVLLSAQCTDGRVNLVTPALFARASTPEEMARLSYEEVQNIIRTCGLSQTKAKNIVQLSRILAENHGGKVPSSFEELESLPGVGHKTASVVMVQAFHVPAFPVDTHIYRSAVRWGLSTGKTVEAVEGDLKKLYPPERWGKLHLQIILYARRFCPARGHIVAECPICCMLENLP